MADIIKSYDEKRIIRVISSGENESIDGDYDAIMSYSFCDLKNLRSVRFTGNVGRIEAKAFVDCPLLEEIIFVNDVKENNDFAFNCNEAFPDLLSALYMYWLRKSIYS